MKNASEMLPVSKDWEFVLERLGEVDAELLDALKAEGIEESTPESLLAVARVKWLKEQKLDALMPRFKELGLSYQEMLAILVMGMGGTRVIVETGVHTGVSTRLLAEAVKRMGGSLISIDSSFKSEKFARDKMIAAAGDLPDLGDWRFIGRRSVDALVGVAEEMGGWDVFVHDSDHGLECQTFELEYGWSMLRNGGLLVCNGWQHPKPNGNPHRAFERFCTRRGLEFSTIGSAAVIVRADDAISPVKASPRQMFKAAIAVATEDKSHLEPGSPPAYATYLND